MAGVVELVQGDDKTLTLRFYVNGEPMDLSGTTEIEARLPGANFAVSKKLSNSEIAIISPNGGKVAVILNDSDTVMLKVGEKQGFEVLVDIGQVRRIFQFEKALTVKKRLVP